MTDSPAPDDSAEGEVSPQHPYNLVLESLHNLPSQPWSMLPHPEDETKFYLSGVHGVIAEQMTQTHAFALLTLVRQQQELVEFQRDLEFTLQEMSPRLDELLKKYQREISKLRGDPSPIPPVSKVSDLTFMHAGQYFNLVGSTVTFQLVDVEETEGFMKVYTSVDGTLILSKDLEVREAEEVF